MVGGEPDFPEARALQYSLERWRAYLPCSGWVRESPRRYGRLNADSRTRTALRESDPAAHLRRWCAVCTCDPVYARTRFIGRSNDWWLRSVSSRGLNTSLPRCLHPKSIELVFYERPRRRFFSRWVSGLDAFSRYPVVRSCPAVPSRTTGTPVAPNRSSSRTIRSFLSSVKTHPVDSSRPVSRRSKPSSRPPLIGEQPHPCPLLHGQDGGNRHRGSKPLGRYVLLRVTTLLSLG
jgi:hypothetical protein